MDADLLCVILPQVVGGGAGPLESGLLLKQNSRVHVCACVCLRRPSPPGPKEGSGSFSLPGGGASLQAASGVNRQEPAVHPQPAPRARAGRGASRRGQRKLDGAPGGGPGARPPAGLGEESRASGASGRGRRAGSERGCARGLAGAPGFLGAGPLPPPPGRDAASSFPPASARPGPGALSLHLSRRAGGSGGASREGAAPRGQRPGRGLAPGASGSPRAPPGRTRALGLTRLGYGAGEVGAGSLRGPSGALLAGPGPASPEGPGAPAAAGWGRECPPRALRPRSGRQVAFARRPNVVGAKPRQPLPFRLAGRARPPSDASRGRSWRPPARGATAWKPAPRGLGQPFQVQRVSGCSSSPSWDAPASLFGPQVWMRGPPSPPYPFRGGEAGRRLAARAGRRNSLLGTRRGAEVSRCRQDRWSSL